MKAEELRRHLDLLATHHKAICTFSDRLTKAIEQRLKLNGVSAKVSGRLKDPASIAEKLVRKGYAIEKFDDLVGIRITLDSIEDRDVVVRILREYALEMKVRVKEEASYALPYRTTVSPEVMNYHSDAIHLVVQDLASDCPLAKAEIQVRSSLTNTWGDVQHRLVYKGEHGETDWKNVTWAPASPVEPLRDAGRLKGSLELLDKELQQTVLSLDRIDAYEGPLLSQKEHESCVDRAEAVSAAASAWNENQSSLSQKATLLASLRELVRLLRSEGRLDEAGVNAETLRGLLSQEERTFQDELEEILLLKDPVEVEKRRKGLLKRMDCEGGPSQNQAPGRLSEVVGRVARSAYTRALVHRHRLIVLAPAPGPKSLMEDFGEALSISPSDPMLLAEELHCLLRAGKKPEELAASKRTQIEAALARCQTLMDQGLEIPRAVFCQARFMLLLDMVRPGEQDVFRAFNTYAYALGMIRSKSYVINHDAFLDAEKAYINDLCKGKAPCQRVEEVLWLFDHVVNSHKQHKTEELAVIVAGTCRTGSFEAHDLCDSMLGAALAGKLKEGVTLSGFPGWVVGGGTNAGVSGLTRKHGSADKLVGFPHSDAASCWDKTKVRQAETGEDYPSLAPVFRYWKFLLEEKKLHPENITLLGFGGGEVSGAEYALAVALGARVGILPQAGRSGLRMLRSGPWGAFSNLAMLPPDPATYWFFVQRPSWKGFEGLEDVTDETKERLAALIHKAYQDLYTYMNLPPDTRQDFEKLKPGMKESNIAQVNAIPLILSQAGFKLCPAKKGKAVKEFDEKSLALLAELEHGRWNAERLATGDRFDLKRDRVKKRHPDLVPWPTLKGDGSLSEETYTGVFFEFSGKEVEAEKYKERLKDFAQGSIPKDMGLVRAWPKILSSKLLGSRHISQTDEA